MPSHGRVNDFEIFLVARTSRHGNSGTLMLSGCVRGSDALWPLRIRPRPHVMHEDDATKDYTALTSELKPPPTNRPQRRGGFSLGLVRGDRSGRLRNSSATERSRCPLSPFAGHPWRPALLRRGR